MRRVAIAMLVLLLGACNTVTPEKKQINFIPVAAIEHPYFFSNEIGGKRDSSDEPWRFQMAGTEYSFIGNEKEVSDNFYRDIPDRPELDDSSFAVFTANYKAVSAKQYILDRAKKERIVIINEAHHKAKHRILTSSLLQELYDQGFRYFGAEAFSDTVSTRLNKRKYPIYKTGYYIREPQFGALVREALEIGFTAFPYEGEGNNKEREINQARNIGAFLKEHPEAKVLIHCGYAHATEGELNYGNWEKAMAGRLTEFTRINPLTVNQTKYDNKYEFKHLMPIQKRLNITEPTVFVDSMNLSFEGKENDKEFDIMVFHEQTTYEYGRPKWLLGETKKWVKVELDSLKLIPPYLLFAIKKEEDMNTAVPADLVEIDSIQTEVYFALNNGSYNVVAQTKDKEAFLSELEVK